MTAVAADDTLFHIALVDVPTLVMATIAAMKIKANIRPYSTAVAALVDRISADRKFIGPPLTEFIVPEVAIVAQEG